jgi:hypothetical protein
MEHGKNVLAMTLNEAPVNSPVELSSTVEPAQQSYVDAIKMLVTYLIAGIERGGEISFIERDESFVLIAKMADVLPQAGRIPDVGMPGSGLLFIDEYAVPPESVLNWLRAHIQEHLAAAPQTLLVVIPLELVYLLVAHTLPESTRKEILQYWAHIRMERKELCGPHGSDVLRRASGTAGVINATHDWNYLRDYILGMQICAAAINEAGLLSPSGICWFMGEVQDLSVVCPRDHSNGLRDALFDFQLAMLESDVSFFTRFGTLSELLGFALENSPAVFSKIGWNGVLPPDIA